MFSTPRRPTPLLFLVLLCNVIRSNSNVVLSLGIPSSTMSLLPGNTMTTSLPSEQLQPNHYYELRVNWPATHPGKFTIWIDHNKDAILPPSTDELTLRRRRHLLNAHKEIFQFQMFNGKVQETYGHIRVEKEGISWDPEIENRPVLFNLIVEEVYLGILPKSSVPLVVCLLIVIGIGLIFVVPRIEVYLQQQQHRTNKKLKERR